MSGLAGSDLNGSLDAQEAWDLTMVERARRETGRDLTPEQATRWYQTDRAKREATND